MSAEEDTVSPPPGPPNPPLRHLSVGEVLFHQGEPGDVAYVVDSGLLELSRRIGTAEVVIATCGPGDMLGEMALIDDEPRSATVRALQPTVLTVIPRADFERDLATATPAVRRLLERFAAIIRAVTDRNVRLTLGLR